MSNEEPISVMKPYGQVIELILALGMSNLDQLPNPWMHQIDKDWHVAVNPQEEARVCTNGKIVPAKGMYFEFRGEPAAMVTTEQWVHNNDHKADRNRRALMTALDAALEKVYGTGGQA